MPGWLEVIVNILLFIFCLSSLILVHEAGHFAAAKIFKVYCDDFSIGFGKAFFSKRRKGGETSFSLRILPLGGYVAMAADEGEIREGVIVPKERSIAGVAKWKGAIIMSAGIFVNIIVSILLLYVSNQAFAQQALNANYFEIKENSIAEKSHYKATGKDGVSPTITAVFTDPRSKAAGRMYYSLDSYAYYEDGSKMQVAAVIDTSKPSFNNHSLDSFLQYYEIIENQNIEDKNYNYSMTLANFAEEVKADSKNEAGSPLAKIELNIPTYQHVKVEREEGLHPYDDPNTVFYCTVCGETLTRNDLLQDENGKLLTDANGYVLHKGCTGHGAITRTSKTDPKDSITYARATFDAKSGETLPMELPVIKDGDKFSIADAGIGIYKSVHKQGFAEAWNNTFKDFSQGSSMIFTTLGGLFIGQGWDQVGSIISIFNQQSTILSGFGGGMLFRYWGLISVNLAIFNLLPFPGLDGWQLLVIAVEGITRKKIPDKAKAIMSYVGLGLLMLLMVVLVVKDIIMLFL